jgi:UDP-N-acetylglucosamine transferase subunit ALG13
MIFVTVGTDLPFDRMMRVIDGWAGDTGQKDIFAQIGETEWRPCHMGYSKFLEPPEFVRRFNSATIIIAHAGMGTILSALRYQKPILVMPRRASLGEQRNEHQLATAQRLAALGKISVAFDEASLRDQLDRLDQLHVKATAGAFADPQLLASLRRFIVPDETSVTFDPITASREAQHVEPNRAR